MTDYLRNVWYMAGWADEIVGEAMLSRRLLGRPVLLFRRAADGLVTALDDRCPHRFAPLSRGTRTGDQIICGYHGLQFDASGACVRNPFARPGARLSRH
jgi:phenylpropionate dioxygenase-like ring-hydroxylating dioxygenase large terminal subunit